MPGIRSKKPPSFLLHEVPNFREISMKEQGFLVPTFSRFTKSKKYLVLENRNTSWLLAISVARLFTWNIVFLYVTRRNVHRKLHRKYRRSIAAMQKRTERDPKKFYSGVRVKYVRVYVHFDIWWPMRPVWVGRKNVASARDSILPGSLPALKSKVSIV